MYCIPEAVLKLENWNKDESKLRKREDDIAKEVGPILWLVAQCVTACRKRARVL